MYVTHPELQIGSLGLSIVFGILVDLGQTNRIHGEA